MEDHDKACTRWEPQLVGIENLFVRVFHIWGGVTFSTKTQRWASTQGPWNRRCPNLCRHCSNRDVLEPGGFLSTPTAWGRGLAADLNGHLSTELRVADRIGACGGGSVPAGNLSCYLEDPWGHAGPEEWRPRRLASPSSRSGPSQHLAESGLVRQAEPRPQFQSQPDRCASLAEWEVRTASRKPRAPVFVYHYYGNAENPSGRCPLTCCSPPLEATDRILQEIAAVGCHLETLDSRISELTVASSSIRADIAGFREAVHNLDQGLTIVKDHVAVLPGQEAELRSLRAKVIDLEDRSRRDNIHLFGILEHKEGSDVKTFLKNLLPELSGLEYSPPLAFQRAHRIGPLHKETSDKPQPIVVCFLRPEQARQTILAAKS
ncbi:hypothetical protein NDU88_004378 [Pleurodeles waltl]|uniref:Uncharacterized protein n=1 Tax=Pleurodeles waltl TaxID=8319 RepID=A0AAV7PFU2_PLEWA|nr:hypothetical protein NDU88_004378 [Pleurodeles waltl]